MGGHFIGEPAGIRTRDLLIKSQLLYRLSYRLPKRPLRGARKGGTAISVQAARLPRTAGRDISRVSRRDNEKLALEKLTLENLAPRKNSSFCPAEGRGGTAPEWLELGKPRGCPCGAGRIY